MSFMDVVAAIRSHPLVIACAVVLGLGLGAVASVVTPTTYTASSMVYFSARGADDTTALAAGASFVHDQMPTYQTLLTSSSVLEKVAVSPGIEASPGELAGALTAEVPTDSTVMTISATGDSKEAAAGRATAATDALAQEVEHLEAQPSLGAPPVRTQVVGAATPDSATAGNHVVVYSAIGGVLGLLAGLAFAALTAYRAASRRR